MIPEPPPLDRDLAERARELRAQGFTVAMIAHALSKERGGHDVDVRSVRAVIDADERR